MKINCADAITLITGRLFVSVDRMYSLYNEMTGDNLYTHQIPRAYKACHGPVSAELPQLTEWLRKKYDNFSPKWELVLAEACEKFGDSFEVSPLSDFERIDPLEELTRKVGTDKIIVVKT